MRMQNLNCKMEIEILKFKISRHESKITEKHSKIYSQGKSENSQRSFRFESARKVDQRALSKIFKTK